MGERERRMEVPRMKKVWVSQDSEIIIAFHSNKSVRWCFPAKWFLCVLFINEMKWAAVVAATRKERIGFCRTLSYLPSPISYTSSECNQRSFSFAISFPLSLSRTHTRTCWPLLFSMQCLSQFLTMCMCLSVWESISNIQDIDSSFI